MTVNYCLYPSAPEQCFWSEYSIGAIGDRSTFTRSIQSPEHYLSNPNIDEGIAVKTYLCAVHLFTSNAGSLSVRLTDCYEGYLKVNSKDGEILCMDTKDGVTTT
jgi:hypothetical protein